MRLCLGALGLLVLVSGCSPEGEPAESVEESSSLSAPCGKLSFGESIQRGESVWSCNGLYRLYLQPDGNLVLHGPTGPRWMSGTYMQYECHPSFGCGWAGREGHLLRVERSAVLRGDKAFRAPGYPRFAAPLMMASKSHLFPSHLAVQDDGNLALWTASGELIWWSGAGWIDLI